MTRPYASRTALVATFVAIEAPVEAIAEKDAMVEGTIEIVSLVVNVVLTLQVA